MLLEKILGVDEIKEISNEFFAEYRAISGSWEGRDDDTKNNKTQENDIYKVKKTPKKIFVIPLVIVVCAAFYYIFDAKSLFKDDNKSLLHSDLSLPQKGILLGRSQIVSKLKKSFRNSKGINAVALVGVCGSGKSTIARSYAKESGA